MRRDGLRLALEAWNFCNEVGAEAPGMGSPRMADCFDLGLRHFHFSLKQSDPVTHDLTSRFMLQTKRGSLCTR